MIFIGDLMQNQDNWINKYLLSLDLNLNKIKEIIGLERYQHTLLVAEAALNLARQNKVNLKKTLKAALLHDIAKNKSKKDLKKIIKKSKWKVDELEISIFPVLHAPAGAVIAEKEFAVKDQEVLEAIRFHTLAHPEMGKIAQIIYAADFISKDRNFRGLDEIRDKIEENFENALYLISTHILKHQLKQGNIIHPFSNDFRNKLIRNKSFQRSDL